MLRSWRGARHRSRHRRSDLHVQESPSPILPFRAPRPPRGFLWLDQFAGIPILDAFCSFLLEPREDFLWTAAPEPVRISHVQAAAAQAMAQAASNHIMPEPPSFLRAMLAPTTADQEPEEDSN